MLTRCSSRLFLSSFIYATLLILPPTFVLAPPCIPPAAAPSSAQLAVCMCALLAVVPSHCMALAPSVPWLGLELVTDLVLFEAPVHAALHRRLESDSRAC